MIFAHGPTGSVLTHLEGSLSQRRYDSDQLMGADPQDDRPLLVRYDLVAASAALSGAVLSGRRGHGLWRWHELLPVRGWESVVTLGEGSTPLLHARRLGREVGLERLYLKAESLNPTGSFKARGMAVAVSRALELGAKSVVVPSAGNAGGAMAAYAAAAGLGATVVMPADAPTVNKLEAVVSGARLILVDGLISDCGRLAARLTARTGAFNLSTFKEPYRVEGKKTMGFELAEDLEWRLPDAIVYPTGGGTGLVGMWKAFAELEAIGLVDARRPRMYAVQMEGCAPMVRAYESEARFAQIWEGAVTQAAGMRVPGSIGDFLVLDCVRASGGMALTVPEAELKPTQRLAASRGCGFLSLESAAALAAVRELAAKHIIDEDEVAVVFDTGAGFKSEFAIGTTFAAPLPNDDAAWEQNLESGSANIEGPGRRPGG